MRAFISFHYTLTLTYFIIQFSLLKQQDKNPITFENLCFSISKLILANFAALIRAVLKCNITATDDVLQPAWSFITKFENNIDARVLTILRN